MNAFVLVGVICLPAAVVSAIKGDIVGTMIYGTITAAGLLVALCPED